MKAIVTTTINETSEALYKYSKMHDWQLYIVGDLKTPLSVQQLDGAIYLSTDMQEKKYPLLSKLIGWNSIQRRNIGFIEAYNDGAEIIATVDDDNIPYDDWGKNLLIGKTIEIDNYENEHGFFDPLSVTNISHMWHRGCPIKNIPLRHDNNFLKKINTTILVEASLWDGDPDVDAMCRLQYGQMSIKLTGPFPYTTKSLTVFNSQNTFLHRSVIPNYCVIAHSKRMDDIWGGMILQKHLPECSIAFTKPSVYQDRNYHNIVKDLECELMGHYKTELIINDVNNLPKECLQFYNQYLKYFKQT